MAAAHTVLQYCTVLYMYSTVLYCTVFSDRIVQLSTTDVFCRKKGKCCTIKYYVRKIQNPWILGEHETVDFNITVFSIFPAKNLYYSNSSTLL